MPSLRDIDSIGDGANGNTAIALLNSAITLNTNATQRLIVATNGQIVLGANSVVAALVYINGSSASPLASAAASSGAISLDFATANNFTIRLSAAATLLAPLNATVGQSGVIFVVQPVAGGATLGFGTPSAWKWPNGATPTLSSTANAVDSIVYVVRSTGATPFIAAQFVQNFA
jgi:hypothetical protein